MHQVDKEMGKGVQTSFSEDTTPYKAKNTIPDTMTKMTGNTVTLIMSTDIKETRQPVPVEALKTPTQLKAHPSSTSPPPQPQQVGGTWLYAPTAPTTAPILSDTPSHHPTNPPPSLSNSHLFYQHHPEDIRRLYVNYAEVCQRLNRLEACIRHLMQASEEQATIILSSFVQPPKLPERSPEQDSPVDAIGWLAHAATVSPTSPSPVHTQSDNPPVTPTPQTDDGQHGIWSAEQRRALDHYCLPLLRKRITPTTSELNTIISRLESTYPTMERRRLLSKVREWFRKRREYMSSKVFTLCERLFPHSIDTQKALDKAVYTLKHTPQLLESIVRTANLDLEDISIAREFCYEKSVVFLKNALKRAQTNNNHAYGSLATADTTEALDGDEKTLNSR